ncbi:MAG: glycosyltransferase family 1 protein [Bauldia sp.]
MTTRFLFDLSSLIRWHGPAVGLVRSQQQLARYARASRTDIVFVVFDPFAGRLRSIKPEWVEAIVENRASIEPALAWSPGGQRGRIVTRLPRSLGKAYLWVTKSRRMRLSRLQRRLAKSAPGTQPSTEKRIRRLMKPGEKTLYMNKDGSLRPCPPLDMVLDEGLVVGPEDVLICAGADWYHLDIDAIVAEKARVGFRHVVVCYDIIPMLFPQWFEPRDAAIVRTYFQKAFVSADRVIFNSRSAERDAQAFCLSEGFELADTRVVALGSDVPGSKPTGTDLPDGLVAGRFAVFVSTIEPRKNHKLLVDVWRRLAAEGVIAATNFKLVFAGRRGWKMDAFFARLHAEPEFGRSILHLPDMTDDMVATLYTQAAFSLYPSIYEGYGLPPVESMLLGTPVIASTGGSVPEVVGDAAPCLDPTDFEAWYREIRQMIEDEEHRRRRAAQARSYSHVTWREHGERFFAATSEPFAPKGATDPTFAL